MRDEHHDADQGGEHEEWIHAIESVPTAGWGGPRTRPRDSGREGLATVLSRRLVRRGLLLSDSLLIALGERSKDTFWGDLKTFFSPRTRHFHRPGAALRLLDKIVPGTACACGRLALDASRLPIAASALAPLDYGTGETVYTLGTAREPLVCKVQRASLGRPLSELVALAAQRRKVHDAVLRHYHEVRDCFPPAHFLVVHGPLFRVPAVVSLQPFVEGGSRDLLRDYDDTTLARLFAEAPRLRDRTVRFLERTLDAWEEREWIVDLGKGNLLLNEGPTGHRLVYTDVQMKRVERLGKQAREEVYQPAIERIRQILRIAGGPAD